MTIKTPVLALVTLGIFLLGIGGSMVFNIWNTETTKQPAKFASGSFSGLANPADIRGSYSLSDIANAFPISVDVLAQAFDVPQGENAGSFQVKELEAIYGAGENGTESVNGAEGEIGTDSVRLFVALYTGYPYSTSEETKLLPAAFKLLEPKLSSADYQAALVHAQKPKAEALAPTEVKTAEPNPVEVKTVEAKPAEAKATNAKATEAKTSENTTERFIKGNTTFADLLTWGLSKAQIEEVLGKPIGKSTDTVRNYLSELGLEFSSYKTILQELLDKAE